MRLNGVWLRGLIGLCVLAAVTLPAPGEAEALAAAQAKLRAQRAAELDAGRKLAEQVLGLYVTATTRVRDFISHDEILMTEMDQHLRGIDYGPPRHFDDGSCEVDAQMTVEQVVRMLNSIHERRRDETGWKREQFDEVIERTEKQVIEVTGYGCASAEPSDGDTPIVAGVLMRAGRGPSLPEIYQQHSAQRRLMAQRAAEIDAYRRLVEHVYGLRISASSTIRDFAATNDRIDAAVQQHLRGARLRGIEYGADGVVKVTMELTVYELVTTTRRMIDEAKVDQRIARKATERTEQQTRRKVIVVTGRGVMTAATD